MMTKEQLVELCKAPLALVTIKDPYVIQQLNDLLPYSIGFEIECDFGENYNTENFKAVPDIMHVDNNSTEQRYRIPNGIKGIVCLYNICNQLLLNSVMNLESGIHYHVDCQTDESFRLVYQEFQKPETIDWLLKELDTWRYWGTYNTRGVTWAGYGQGEQQGAWVRQQEGFQTFEFRIGEMSFDHLFILKRMIHLCEIMKTVKDKLSIAPLPYEPVNWKAIVEYRKNVSVILPTNLDSKLTKFTSELRKIEEEERNNAPVDPLQAINPYVRNRTHRI